MDLEDGQDDEGPVFAWLPPEDRLWRHPSELGAGARRAAAPLLAAASRSRSWTTAVCAAAIGAMLAAGVGYATGAWGHRTIIEPVSVPTPDTVSLAVSTPNSPGDWSALADALAPSVVAVTTVTAAGTEESSGVLFAAARHDSYIITAADATGSKMAVTFDGGRAERARLVGSDPTSDVAVLAVAGARRHLPPIGSVSAVEVADPVLTVGLRDGGTTAVADGTLTSLDQQVETAGGVTYDGMIAVSGGSLPQMADGGAVVDAAGAVVGIATDVTSASPRDQGVTYAVPIDVADHVAEEILEGDRPAHPWLGIDESTDVSSAAARQLGVVGGAQVGGVASGSPAAVAGLRPDDVVVGFDGHPVRSSGELVTLLAQCHPGQRASISYMAGGRTERRALITVAGEPG
ncbi:MAG TPA: trypsin-like peptidase domain-containing protein [Acidimicrobiales bacterium]|nr:trypsin-like peptidase domain-containing protein [Acidimicrobiales bacterium]